MSPLPPPRPAPPPPSSATACHLPLHCSVSPTPSYRCAAGTPGSLLGCARFRVGRAMPPPTPRCRAPCQFPSPPAAAAPTPATATAASGAPAAEPATTPAQPVTAATPGAPVAGGSGAGGDFNDPAWVQSLLSGLGEGVDLSDPDIQVRVVSHAAWTKGRHHLFRNEGSSITATQSLLLMRCVCSACS